MDAKTLYALMDNDDAKAPHVRCVTSLYATRLAAIAPKLSPGELEQMIELGVVVHRRSTVLVPVLSATNVADWLTANGMEPGTA